MEILLATLPQIPRAKEVIRFYLNHVRVFGFDKRHGVFNGFHDKNSNANTH
jgi:hypothetical protein